MSEIETHPVQTPGRGGPTAQAPTSITLRAYEVYCFLHGPQEAMVTGDCRGGFGAAELIAFLYARTFPQVEWGRRVHEALNGMKYI